jgi:N-acylneuraminate cytidylyltransferase
MKIAIIPARGGSKRIPRKNVGLFHGRPIIEWVIEIARESGCFDAVVVSTDDQEVMDIALRNGALVPFIRPPNLSDDATPTLPVISHALETLKDHGLVFSAACCVYPTSVFVTQKALRDGLTLLESGNCNYVISVTPYTHPIERAMRMSPCGIVSMHNPSQECTRSQDIEHSFHDAGQFYWGSTKAWLTREPILSGRTKAIVFKGTEVRDIDDISDWEVAEQLFALKISRSIHRGNDDDTN